MKTLFRSLSCSVYFAAVTATGFAIPAYASGGGSEASGESNNNRTLDLPNLVVPVEHEGALINYLFVSTIVTIGDGFDLWDIRENAHVYRDLILKEAHKHTVGKEGKPMQLDDDKFKTVLMKVFEEKVGKGVIASIEIVTSDSQRIFLEG